MRRRVVRAWTRAEVDTWADETEEPVLLADGLDDALVGVAVQFNQAVAVYDRERAIEVLCRRDRMTREDAEEYFSFNVVGAYVGPQTPVFLLRPLGARA